MLNFAISIIFVENEFLASLLMISYIVVAAQHNILCYWYTVVHENTAVYLPYRTLKVCSL